MEGEGGKVAISTESLNQMMVGVGSPTAEQSRVALARGRSISTPTGADNNTGAEPILPAGKTQNNYLN